MHVWLLDASTPPRQSWAATNTDGVSIQGLSMAEWAGGSTSGGSTGGGTGGSTGGSNQRINQRINQRQRERELGRQLW